MKMKNDSCVILSLLFLIFHLETYPSFGANIISADQPLSGDQTIVSSGGNFELGFFKPGNHSNYYIGMGYKKMSTQTIVWVANREKPVSDMYSSELTFQNGNLVLLDESKIPVWSTNISSAATNPVVAVLGDDGNLVLVDQSNPKQPLWQSFDNPAHAWLPGAKLAYNNRTKTKQLLTSWKNSEDPAPGLFSVELDPIGKQYVMRWNRSELYYSSGSWNGEFFSLVPEMRLNYIFNFSYITNINESYFTYSYYNPSNISGFMMMDVSGQVKQFIWLETTNEWKLSWPEPRLQCEVYAYCGAYGTCNQNALAHCNCLTGFTPRLFSDWNLNDYSGGCVRDTSLQCGNANSTNGKDGFLPSLHVRLPDNSQSLAVSSAAECESACLGNCSCIAYAYDNSGCSIWNKDLLNMRQLPQDDGDGKTIYIRLAASELSGTKNNKGIVTGAVAGSVSVVLVLLGLGYTVIQLQRRRLVRIAKALGESLVVFGYKDLQIVTKNFSIKLGGGGFGSVFRGTMPDSSLIAVKKLEGVRQGDKQFRAEVSTIGTIQHVNILRLRGFCSEGNNKLLVYDYMPNGSLDSYLFQENYSKILDWKTRYQIALGTARGLAYLHENCRECIIHCDIKPENILLDADLYPKVADFGLAKLFGHDFSRVLTTTRGTIGYLAPEWISGVAITAKADVYSYGMMLFELVSGKRNTQQCKDANTKYFPILAAVVIQEGGDVLGLLDNKLDRSADENEVARICRLACWCIQDNENHRPSMRQVVLMLEGLVDITLPPIPQILLAFANDEENTTISNNLTSTQVHNLREHMQSKSSI